MTVAPEANERIRMLADKNITDQAFFSMFEKAKQHGFTQIKMYFIIGLPEQTENDLREMLSFIQEAKKRFGRRIYVSVNPLVPKPKTPYEYLSFAQEKIKQQISFLHKYLATKMKMNTLRNAELEWKLAFAKDLDFMPLLRSYQRISNEKIF